MNFERVPPANVVSLRNRRLTKVAAEIDAAFDRDVQAYLSAAIADVVLRVGQAQDEALVDGTSAAIE